MSGLLASLGVGRGDVVSVAGAGGKTTLVYALAAEARASGLRVLVTTTTHMGLLPEAVTGPVLVDADGEGVTALLAALEREGRATLLGRRVRPDKLEGVSPRRVDALARLADLVLVEADGARSRSLKVPGPHEPVVPASTSLLLVLAAMDALGTPLDERRVHRSALTAAAAGRAQGSTLDETAIAAVLAHPPGYPSRVPKGARSGVVLNKVEDPAGWAAAARIAARLVPPYGFVAAGALRSGQLRVIA